MYSTQIEKVVVMRTVPARHRIVFQQFHQIILNGQLLTNVTIPVVQRFDSYYHAGDHDFPEWETVGYLDVEDKD